MYLRVHIIVYYQVKSSSADVKPVKIRITEGFTDYLALFWGPTSIDFQLAYGEAPQVS